MKTALITGASSGIGEAFAWSLAAENMGLVLVARSEAKLQSLAQKLHLEYNIPVLVIVQDLTAPGSAAAVMEKVAEHGLSIDLLINNAGFADYGAFADRALSRQLEMIQLNVTALVELTYLCLAEMRQRDAGSIVNVSSISAFQAVPYFSVYGATKAFVLHFTEALWAELRGTGIRILALCPGPASTNLWKTAELPDTLPDTPALDTSRLESVEDVVSTALKALSGKQPNVVTGGLKNQAIVNVQRFVPRGLLAVLTAFQLCPPKD
jgi:hypothetical protein